MAKERVKTRKKASEASRMLNDIFLSKRHVLIRVEIGLLLLIISYLHFFNTLTVQLIRLAAFVICCVRLFARTGADLGQRRVLTPNTLLCVAAILTVLLGRTAEAVVLLILFELFDIAQQYLYDRASAAVASLLPAAPESVTLISGEDVISDFPVAEVRPGDLITFNAGDLILIDGVVREGESLLDVSAVTGEEEEQACRPGSTVYSGSVNLSATLTVEAVRSFNDSVLERTRRILASSAAKKSLQERVIGNFSRVAPLVLVCAAVVTGLIIPLFGSHDYGKWLYRAVILLIAAYPAAYILSLPLAYAAAIGRCAKKGVLFKSNAAFDTAADLTSVIFDKTGVISAREFQIVNIVPAEGMDTKTLLKLALCAEKSSEHPLARCICAYAADDVADDLIAEHTELPGQGSTATLTTGQRIIAGSADLMDSLGIAYEPAETDATVVYIAADGRYAGRIECIDEPREDAEEAVAALRRCGVVNTALMTGDSALAANWMGRRIGITEIYADCSPGDKLERLRYLFKLENGSEKMAYIGDGSEETALMEAPDLTIVMNALETGYDLPAPQIFMNTDKPSFVARAIAFAKDADREIDRIILWTALSKALLVILGLCGVMPAWLALLIDASCYVYSLLCAARPLK